jgi:hypothetical protein
MKFDDFLHTINGFGRYQKLRFFCMCLTFLLPHGNYIEYSLFVNKCFFFFNLVMISTRLWTPATPSFRCKLHENDSVYHNYLPILYNRTQPDPAYCKAMMNISVREYQQCYMKTISKTGIEHMQPCKDYVFDRTYMRYTLVEEVGVSSL